MHVPQGAYISCTPPNDGDQLPLLLLQFVFRTYTPRSKQQQKKHLRPRQELHYTRPPSIPMRSAHRCVLILEQSTARLLLAARVQHGSLCRNRYLIYPAPIWNFDPAVGPSYLAPCSQLVVHKYNMSSAGPSAGPRALCIVVLLQRYICSVITRTGRKNAIPGTWYFNMHVLYTWYILYQWYISF